MHVQGEETPGPFVKWTTTPTAACARFDVRSSGLACIGVDSKTTKYQKKITKINDDAVRKVRTRPRSEDRAAFFF